MKTPSRTLSGIDIQKDYLSIAQYSPEENAVLNVAIRQISGSGKNIWENASHEIKELKKQFKFQSPEVICSLPTEYAVVKRVEVDDGEPDIQGLIEWELSQHIIGSIEEYTYDFQEYATGPDGGNKDFLAVAYRNDTVGCITSMLKGQKLNPSVVDLDVFAIVNVFEANYPEYVNTPAIIVHGEGEKTKVILTRDAMFLDSSFFEYNQGELTPASYAEMLQTEINRLLSVNSSVVEQSGIGLFFTGLIFSQQEYVESVVALQGNGEILYPFRKVANKVGRSMEELMTYASQLGVAVGLALRGNE